MGNFEWLQEEYNRGALKIDDKFGGSATDQYEAMFKVGALVPILILRPVRSFFSFCPVDGSRGYRWEAFCCGFIACGSQPLAGSYVGGDVLEYSATCEACVGTCHRWLVLLDLSCCRPVGPCAQGRTVGAMICVCYLRPTTGTPASSCYRRASDHFISVLAAT